MKESILKTISKVNVFMMFSVILPFVYGCGGGGSASVGSLFGTSAPTSGVIASDPGTTTTGITTVHNPEPGTLLLLGGGMVAMGFVRSRMRK